MNDITVKLINQEIVKVSAVKSVDNKDNVVSIENHLGEIFHFSPHTFLYIKETPSDSDKE